MLKMADISVKCSSLTSDKAKIEYLMSLVKKERIIQNDNGLEIVSTFNINNYLISSTNRISPTKYNGISSIEKILFAKFEHEMVINKIINAINKIVLPESRKIFVEKYLYGYSVTKSSTINYLCNSSYYAYLHQGEKNFLTNMKL